MVRVALAAFGLLITTPAAAQPIAPYVDPDPKPEELSNEVQAAAGEHLAEPNCQAPANDGGNKSSLARDAGGAAANTGGAIAGGAVGGPIGAAVGGVVADHAIRAVGKLLGGKHKNDRDSAAVNCQQGEIVDAGTDTRLDP
jgi:hypothetical protein